MIIEEVGVTPENKRKSTVDNPKGSAYAAKLRSYMWG
jgi:hypothetical protein